MRQSGKTSKGLQTAINEVINGKNVVFCVSSPQLINYCKNIAIQIQKPLNIQRERIFYTNHNFLTISSINSDWNRFRGIRNISVHFDHYVYESSQIKCHTIKEWELLDIYTR